jgi:uncharacterized protein YjbI with pentapeptide repeats
LSAMMASEIIYRREERKVNQAQNPHERSFIAELVPRWRPSRQQVLWATRLTIASVLVLIVVAFLGAGLWMALGAYVAPKTVADRKDLVQSFAVVVAALVGSLSALAAVGSLIVSRSNLQQQRELDYQNREQQYILEEKRAQETTLLEYVVEMVKLLSNKERPLRESNEGDDARFLARLRAVTVLPQLDAWGRRRVLDFLYESGLITKNHAIVPLAGADLRGAGLGGAKLRSADLSGVSLDRAYLGGADLRESDLSGASLRGVSLLGGVTGLGDADLHGADLRSADLSGAKVTGEQLATCKYLDGSTTMPDGQKYEEWLKDRERHKEDGENE